MYNFINNMNSQNRFQFQKKTYNTQNQQIPYSLKCETPPLLETEAKMISLFSQPYLDTYNQCYKNIVVVNLKPQGPLGELVRFVKFPPLSEFKQQGSCSPLKNCGYAIMSLYGCNTGCLKNSENLMIVDEMPNLISYLVNNGYSINTSITKMFNQSEIRFDTNTGNKLICFITYNG